MPNVSGNIQYTASFTELVTSGVVSNLQLQAGITQALNYTSGTGAGQVDLIYAKQLTLSASATTLDLTNLADLTGSSYSFFRVRELIVANLASTGGYTLSVGSASASAFSAFMGASAVLTVHPSTVSSLASNNILRFSDPTNTGSTSGAVVASNSKLLKLDPGSNSFTVNVIILGCDAYS